MARSVVWGDRRFRSMSAAARAMGCAKQTVARVAEARGEWKGLPVGITDDDGKSSCVETLGFSLDDVAREMIRDRHKAGHSPARLAEDFKLDLKEVWAILGDAPAEPARTSRPLPLERLHAGRSRPTPRPYTPIPDNHWTGTRAVRSEPPPEQRTRAPQDIRLERLRDLAVELQAAVDEGEVEDIIVVVRGLVALGEVYIEVEEDE